MTAGPFTQFGVPRPSDSPMPAFDIDGVCLPHGRYRCDSCFEWLADMHTDAATDLAHDDDADWGDAA